MADKTLTFDIFARDRASKTFEKVGKSVNSTEKSTHGLKSGLTALAGAFAGLAVIDKVTGFLKDSVAEARESQKVGAQTAAVLKSTGNAANTSAKQIGDLATAISLKSGIDDEAVQSGANLLLTFTNIHNAAGKGNDIFNQSTQIMTDMAAAMGKEPKSAAIQLGKALNDPIKGISALGRVGVAFTEKQKGTIKSLVESGHTMDAQKIILRELNKEFGGSAAAQATAGEKMKVAWGNFKEQVGTQLLPILDKLETWFTEKALPAIQAFIPKVVAFGHAFSRDAGPAISTVVDVLGKLFGWMGKNKAVVGTFVGIIAAVVAAMKIWAAVQAALNVVMSANPIGLVVIAIAALVAGLVYAYKHCETFRNIVDTAFRAIAAVVGWAIGFVKDHLYLVMGILLGPFGLAIAWVIKHFDTFKKVAQTVFQAIAAAARWLWENVLHPVFSFIVKALGGVMQMWGKMLQTLGKVPGFEWAKKAGDAMVAAGQKAVSLGDKITKIPDKKEVKVNVTDVGRNAALLAGKLWSIIAYANRLDGRNVRLQITTAYAQTGFQTKGGLQAGTRATGGFVAAGVPYRIGEQGPEMFVPNTGGRIMNARETERMTSGGSVDENRLARAVAKAMSGVQIRVTGVEAGRGAYLITGGA